MENLAKIAGGNIPTDKPVLAVATKECPVYDTMNTSSRVIYTYHTGQTFNVFQQTIGLRNGGHLWTYADSPAGQGAVLNDNYKLK